MSTAVIVAQHTSQTWPTISRVLSTLAALAGSAATALAALNRKHVFEVKAIVNGKFTDQVQQLAATTKALHDMTVERDDALTDDHKTDTPDATGTTT